MKALIDTHTLLWSVHEPRRLSPAAREAIVDSENVRLLSAATVWELAIKVGQGKISLPSPLGEWFERAIEDLSLDLLPITIEYAERQSKLEPHHKDPFDRLIIAQALVDDLAVVSVDAAFDAYGVRRIW